MKLISHRGNVRGKIVKLENTPNYIDKAINEGYDVEIDIWYKNNNLYLGHDYGQHLIDLDWLLRRSTKLWCHAKNGEALHYLWQHPLHYFWHQKDKFTLTSREFIWTYPKGLLYSNSICVLPELGYSGEFNCYGVCSDYIENYK